MTDLQSVVETRGPSLTSERAAAWTFGVYIAVALPVLLWMGSYRWFLGDEWTFLTARSASLHDLVQDHNGHWITLPLLVYRGLYSLFGLHEYWPYQLVVIGLHLTAAVLLRVVMRRARVGPWIATVAAGAFVLLGPAEDNILWAFQITFVSSLVLGLVQLLFADHDGPIDRRDWYGLGAGLLCLMTSGQAVSLVAATGLVCLFRRRWWAAAFHTVPLAAIYGAWYLVTDVELVTRVDDRSFTASDYVSWMWNAVAGLFDGLGHFGLVGLALAAVLIGGIVLAASSEGSAALLRRAAIPAALLVAAVLSMSLAAPSRFALEGGGARAGRYVGVMAAMTLPALAVGADALARRWRWTAPVVAALLLLPIPFNIVAFGDDPTISEASFKGIRNYVTNLPDHPLAHEVPAWVQPSRGLLGQPDMTLGWLLHADQNGELPDPSEPMYPLSEQLVPVQLGVAMGRGGSPRGLRCADYSAPLPMDPSVGDRWYFDGPVVVFGRAGDTPATLGATYSSTGVEITRPGLRLLLAPVAGQDAFRFCQ